ncbi:hypothetical protein, partial [Streptomyces shenzhenensis]|uniref:2-oxoglutarate dehydrogenase E1 subunit family protein n=1 Tax=Streptomyces shenzhenensis TaxID=943815 RepID=UPI0036CFC3DB
MSSQSPSNPSSPGLRSGGATTTDEQAGKNPTAAFGANEWLVDEIYQQYLQDPNSVDRAWWDFFADYKPGTSGTADKPVPAPTGAVTPAPAATNGATAQAPAAPPAAPSATRR